MKYVTRMLTLPLAALLLTVLALFAGGCGTLPLSGSGAGTAGAPATGTAAAQTVGQDQAAVGGTATGGTAVIHNRFAAEGDAAVRMRILALVEAGIIAPDAVEQLFQAASSAPQTVTIRDVSAHGGDADNAGAGTGEGSGNSGPIPDRP